MKPECIEAYIERAPIILSKPAEAGWSVPPSLLSKLKESRIKNVESGDFHKGLASIVDTVIHLMDASLKYPIPPEYVAIYAYYANIVMDGALAKVIAVRELTDTEKMLAERLRRAILKKQLEALPECRGAKI